jgi:hypothetical protein
MRGQGLSILLEVLTHDAFVTGVGPCGQGLLRGFDGLFEMAVHEVRLGEGVEHVGLGDFTVRDGGLGEFECSFRVAQARL